jgi:hypothetical protein
MHEQPQNDDVRTVNGAAAKMADTVAQLSLEVQSLKQRLKDDKT